jgi:hypothetical protein
MATIQFLAGNPKSGAKKKAVKKSKSKRSPAQKANDKRLGMMAKARFAKKPSKKVSKKKASKKVAPKKGSKKRNPQSYLYNMNNMEFKGMTFPTRQDIARTLAAKSQAIKAKKGASAKDQSKLVDEIRKLTLLAAKQQREIKQGLDEKKEILSMGGKDKQHFEENAGYIDDRKSIDKAKKKAFDAATKAKGALTAAKKAAIAKAKLEKIKKAKIAQQTKQGVYKVAKKKSASKKVSKKKATKKRSKKDKKTVVVVAKKPSRKKASKKSSKKGGKKSNPRRKHKKIFSMKKRSNPSISSITGQSDNMAVAGLAIGGFSYNLFNDLGKRYLPSKVMEYIAMVGPVSGAVIPSAVAGLVLWASSKYPQNKALKHASNIAKGVIASAVVIAGASVYQVVAQAPVKKFIGLSGDESMYGEEMYGQSDSEFSGQADSEFSGQAISEFSGDDEDEFGEDEF